MTAFYRCLKLLDDEISFDIFHGFYFSMGYPCLLVAEKGGRPVIASIRGDELEKWALQANGLSYVLPILKKATWITTVGRDLIHVATALEDISGRLSFIPNSINPNPPHDLWRATSENDGIVGTLGRFANFKDIPNLVMAYSQVKERVRRRLLLVGNYPNEPERNNVTELIKQEGLEPEMHLTGYVSDSNKIQGYLKSMRVFVSSSQNEGMPNALLEAAALGVPLVATKVGGINDILVNGESALLVPPSNYQALGEAIEAVLKDQSLATKLSKGALQVAEQLNPKKEKKAWLELYDSVLGIERPER